MRGVRGCRSNRIGRSTNEKADPFEAGYVYESLYHKRPQLRIVVVMVVVIVTASCFINVLNIRRAFYKCQLTLYVRISFNFFVPAPSPPTGIYTFA